MQFAISIRRDEKSLFIFALGSLGQQDVGSIGACDTHHNVSHSRSLGMRYRFTKSYSSYGSIIFILQLFPVTLKTLFPAVLDLGRLKAPAEILIKLETSKCGTLPHRALFNRLHLLLALIIPYPKVEASGFSR